MDIKVNIDDAAVKATFRALIARMRTFTSAMRIIGQIVRTSVIRNFEAGGRPTRWEPSKRVKKKGGMTLVKSHRLMNSVVAKAYADRAEIGTNVIYAAIQQLGGTTAAGERILHFRKYARGKFAGRTLFAKAGKAHFGQKIAGGGATIPARPFLLVQDEDWREIEGAINQYLVGRVT